MLLGVAHADSAVSRGDLDTVACSPAAIAGLAPAGERDFDTVACCAAAIAGLTPGGVLAVIHLPVFLCSPEVPGRLAVGEFGGGFGEQVEAVGGGQCRLTQPGVELVVGGDLGRFGEHQVGGDGVDRDDGGVAGVGVGVDRER